VTEFDPNSPSIARMYSSGLGGKDHVPPGIADSAAWRPGEADAAAASTEPVHGLGVIARI
jgi:hypothetical protein